MMKQHSLIFSLALFFGVLSCTAIVGQTIEKSKKLNKSFPLGSDTEIEISNKYGNIHLVPWEKDSVRFEIELKVKGSKQSRVDKVFNFIDFEFQSTKYYIIAQTVFEGNSFWNDVSELTGTVFSSSTKTKINYTVYLPAGASLKVVNKYGNIYTTDHSGKINIELSNGDLKAHHLSGNTTIKTEFGNTDIKKITDGRLDISYGEFDLDEGKILKIESKSSTFHFKEIGDLQLNSKRDKYFIEKLNVIRGTAYFSRIEMNEITGLLDLSTKYGDMEVNRFSDAVNAFNLQTVNTDVVLHFTDDKLYKLDIVVDGQTEVYYSSGIKNIKSSDVEGEDKLIRVNCVIGNNKQKFIPLTINSQAGSLSLKLK
ncbi:MAG: hypothetical protein L3J31_06365 [Bacteroidales bacterium]|nr:hypothetical protein [Bacteroidales bacterium]